MDAELAIPTRVPLRSKNLSRMRSSRVFRFAGSSLVQLSSPVAAEVAEATRSPPPATTPPPDDDASANGRLRRRFTVGGSLTGLVSGGSVVLQNNGGSDLTVNANGAFSFAHCDQQRRRLCGDGADAAFQPARRRARSLTEAGRSAANVTNVAVNCVSVDQIAPTVTGVRRCRTSSEARFRERRYSDLLGARKPECPSTRRPSP